MIAGTEAAPNLVPLVVVEEHNEALTALAWAQEMGALSSAPVHLYNVDQHADLDVPRLRNPIIEKPQTVREMQAFVETNVAISSFIWMGAYLGLIDHLSWLQPVPPIETKRPKAGKPRKLFIATQGAARTEFITAGARAETDGIGNDDRRPLTIEMVGAIETAGALDAQKLATSSRPFSPAAAPQHMAESEPKQWVLSIDIDYFSCNSQPHNPFRLDVTRETFEAIRSDHRHPLRLSVYHDITLVHDDAGYGVLFDDFEEPEDDLLRRDEAAVSNAIAELEGILSAQPSRPSLIVVSRSRLSGFTPKDQWQDIEAGVLEMLGRIYECECFQGDELWT